MMNEYDVLSLGTDMPMDTMYLHLWKLDVFHEPSLDLK
jgi:hypothetical protein